MDSKLCSFSEKLELGGESEEDTYPLIFDLIEVGRFFRWSRAGKR